MPCKECLPISNAVHAVRYFKSAFCLSPDEGGGDMFNIVMYIAAIPMLSVLFYQGKKWMLRNKQVNMCTCT